MAAASAATAVALGLHQAGVLALSSTTRIVLVALAAAVAFVSSTVVAVGDWRRQRAEARRDDVAFALRGVAFAVQDLTGIDIRELGLAAYVVRRSPLRPWRQVLTRVHRERSARRPAASGIVWRPGVGVIGDCVRSQEAVGQDVGVDQAPYADVDRAGWAAVPEHVKAGLTFEEFQRVVGKYHVVVAVPLIDDTRQRTRAVGCVALDGPAGSYAALWTPDVRDALMSAATTLRQYVL